MKLRAFTLAEVLITLGIIGIVAAMTLPNLVSKYKKSQVETALKKFYTTMNQAVLLSVNENGETKDWKFASNDTTDEVEAFYEKYFSNYIKKVKTGKTGINGKYLFTVYYADGSVAVIHYLGHDWTYCTDAKAVADYKNMIGRKCFQFGFYPDYKNTCGAESYSAKNFHNKGVEPYVNCLAQDENGAIKDENGNAIKTTEKDLYKQKLYTKIIQLNNWKIPDNYPINF